jgi:hypothetical protein
VAASINFLAALDVDVNTHTTMTYGLAHCFAMLTVSNHELHQKALAEQNLTPEQYKVRIIRYALPTVSHSVSYSNIAIK